MSETIEGIGSRKWSLGKSEDGGTDLMQGAMPLALLTADGEQVKHLLVTAPQLWEATNTLVRALITFVFREDEGTLTQADRQRLGVALKQAGDMVAKAVNKDNYADVLQA